MSFAHLLTHAVTYKAITGHDANGDPTLGSAVTIDSYNNESRKLIRNSDGEEAVSTDQVTSDVLIPRECVIWIPPNSPDDNAGRKPIKVASFKDPTNAALTKWKAWL